MRGLILALCVGAAAAASAAPAAPTTHAKKDVRLGASADESKDSAH